MNLTAFIEKLQGLPEEKQAEVLDFVDYLSTRFTRRETQEHVEWSDRDFSLLSVTQAMRGMEDEPNLYDQGDLRERWQ